MEYEIIENWNLSTLKKYVRQCSKTNQGILYRRKIKEIHLYNSKLEPMENGILLLNSEIYN